VRCEDSYVFFIFSTSGVEDILEVEPSSSSNMGDNETLNSTGLEMFGLHVKCNSILFTDYPVRHQRVGYTVGKLQENLTSYRTSFAP